MSVIFRFKNHLVFTRINELSLLLVLYLIYAISKTVRISCFHICTPHPHHFSVCEPILEHIRLWLKNYELSYSLSRFNTHPSWFSRASFTLENLNRKVGVNFKGNCGPDHLPILNCTTRHFKSTILFT